MNTFILAVGGTIIVVLVLQNWGAGEKKIAYRIPADYGVEDPQFLRSMGQLLGPPLADGNQIEGLLNGDQIFPAMLAAIQAGRHTITFETYIFWSGDIGRRFSEALAERAQAGVKVHVLLDWVGSGRMDAASLRVMTQAGVEVEKYRPLRWYHLARLNHRTHRKLLVVDGRVGFTGGVGIADQWLGDAESPDHWRDSHFRLEGPAVGHMQAAFVDNWIKTRSEVLHQENYFPELPIAGAALAQVFQSSDREGNESVRLMYLLSIAAARRTIRLANAYFVPDDLTVASLRAACQRGVRVEVIVPGEHIDTPLVRRASRSLWGPLLKAGIDIYEYQPTMYHCKVMIVDEIWVSVGSTNFDNRSFRLNDEANLNVFDKDFADKQVQVFEQDKAKARRISLAEWQGRPWMEKMGEYVAGWLRSQL